MSKYEIILSIVKEKSIANGIIQAEALTGVNYKDIITSMGFKFELSKTN